ncbi:MAG: CDP-alcohol phosphatidyltransferase family protein [Firmicutes bacterium]|nr:CDP-alcohol phosphatidyltransferase family protein [Bacillota bacterium]
MKGPRTGGTGAAVTPGAAPRVREGLRAADNPFTVIFIDPLAVPLVRWLARRPRVRPNHVTLAGLALGLLAGPLYAWGEAAWGNPWPGAVAFYLALLADCVDGKLAHFTGRTSAAGKRLENLADRGRVLSAWLGFWMLAALRGDLWLAAAAGGYALVPAVRALDRRRRGPQAPDPGRWLQARLRVPEALRRRRIGVWYGSWDRAALCFAVAPWLDDGAGPLALAAVLLDALQYAAGAWWMRRAGRDAWAGAVRG